MKARSLFHLMLLVVLVLFSVKSPLLYGQYIWAGQVSGDNINWNDIDDVLRTGVNTIAVSSAICRSREPKQICRLLKQRMIDDDDN